MTIFPEGGLSEKKKVMGEIYQEDRFSFIELAEFYCL